jgi:hypothetical protein
MSELAGDIGLLGKRRKKYFMILPNCRKHLFVCCVLLLFSFVLLSGCVGSPAGALENRSTIAGNSTGTNTTAVSDTNSSVLINGTRSIPQFVTGDARVRATLDADWRAFRVINMDLTTRYLTLDLSKGDDINYLRYSLLPATVDNLSAIRSELEGLQPSSPDEQNETRTLVLMTNYTILKYQTLSEMLHATQYANMRDPVMLKSEIRNAKLTVMDALDLVNSKNSGDYPSKYRDQIASDKRELDDMMSQIDSYTRTIYQPPAD